MTDYSNFPNDQLISTLQQRDAYIQQIVAQYNEVVAQAGGYYQMAQSLQETNTMLQTQVEKGGEDGEETKQELKKLKEDNVKQEARIQSLTTMIAENEKQVLEASEKVTQLQKQLKQKYVSELPNDIVEMLTDLEKKNETFVHENKQIKQELENYKSTYEQLMTAVDEQTELQTKLEQQLEQQNKRFNDREKEFKRQLEQPNVQSQFQADAFSDSGSEGRKTHVVENISRIDLFKINQLSSGNKLQNYSEMTRSAILQQQAGMNLSSINLHDEAIQQLQSENNDLQELVNVYQSQIEDFEKFKESAAMQELEFQQLHADNERLSREVQEFQRLQHSLRKQSSFNQQQAESLMQVDKMQKSMAEQEQVILQLKDRLKLERQKITDLQQNIRNLSDKKNVLTFSAIIDEIDQLKEFENRKNLEILGYKQLVMQQEQELKESKLAYDQSGFVDFDTKFIGLMNEKAAKLQEMIVAGETKDVYDCKINQLESRNQSLKSENVALQTQIDALNSQLDVKQLEILRKQRDSDSMQQTAMQMQNNYKKLQKRAEEFGLNIDDETQIRQIDAELSIQNQNLSKILVEICKDRKNVSQNEANVYNMLLNMMNYNKIIKQAVQNQQFKNKNEHALRKNQPVGNGNTQEKPGMQFANLSQQILQLQEQILSNQIANAQLKNELHQSNNKLSYAQNQTANLEKQLNTKQIYVDELLVQIDQLKELHFSSQKLNSRLMQQLKDQDVDLIESQSGAPKIVQQKAQNLMNEQVENLKSENRSLLSQLDILWQKTRGYETRIQLLETAEVGNQQLEVFKLRSEAICQVVKNSGHDLLLLSKTLVSQEKEVKERLSKLSNQIDLFKERINAKSEVIDDTGGECEGPSMHELLAVLDFTGIRQMLAQ